MKDSVFLDTNIFVYAKLQLTDQKKHLKAIHFLSTNIDNIIISIQVINEFYSVLIKHKIEDSVIKSAVLDILEDTDLIPLTLHVVKKAWIIRENYHFNYYDCLIVAAALESKCTTLYTEDLQHNQIIENKLRIINPFINRSIKK